MTNHTHSGLVVLVCIGLITGSATAAPITLVNPDFELPSAASPTPGPGGNTYIGSIPGWGVVNAGGVFEPDFGTEVAYPASVQAITGDQTAYSTSDTFGLVTQWLGPTITFRADTVYVLSVDIGHRKATQFLGGFGFFRLSNPFPTPVSIAFAVDPGEGNFTRQTHILVGSDLLPSDLGNTFRIGLFALPDRIVDFDNVTLDISSSIPEPTTLLLLLVGLTAITSRRRGRQ